MNWIKKLFGFTKPEPQRPYKIVHAEYRDKIMVCEFSDGEKLSYYGECTVWYTYPMMERLSTEFEMKLCNIQAYIERHGNPYPTAHTEQRLIK